MADTNFTTGPSQLAGSLDAGGNVYDLLSYNGCTFAPLFETKLSGTVVKDNAQRTTKFMEYTLTADGYVTLPAGATTVSPTMANLRKLLTVQGGILIYKGRGCDIEVNKISNQFDQGLPQFNTISEALGTISLSLGLRDVAWGPVPELLEFQPLGAGRSAKVQWQCKFRIPEVPPGSRSPLLQFNYETTLTYAEDGFATIAAKGTLEIPMTRGNAIGSRTVLTTADSFRILVEKRIMTAIDLNIYRVIHREFSVSRDKRTLEWAFTIEQMPHMYMPEDCVLARGTYTVRPAKAGMGLCNWLCTLRASYTVRADRPRRTAWIFFLAMLRLRMNQSGLGDFGDLDAIIQNPDNIQESPFDAHLNIARGHPLGELFLGPPSKPPRLGNADNNPGGVNTQNAFLIDFSMDEGIYLDSKTMSFSATWRLVTRFAHILLASGLWTQLPYKDERNDSLWATSMKVPSTYSKGGEEMGVMGSRSVCSGKLNSALDIIVDFGGG